MAALASFPCFDDKPARVHDQVSQFNEVTPELVQKTAQEYLRSTNRTVIELQPAPKDAATPAKNQWARRIQMNKTMQKLGLLAIEGSILGITPPVAQKHSPPQSGPP